MRNVGGVLLILALLAAFMLPGLARTAAAPQAVPFATDWLEGSWPNSTGTPRAAFPLYLRNPTLTPTKTPTPTQTRTPTMTPTRTMTVPPPQPMVGNLRREEPSKPSYATNIEDIWHWFWIRNNNPSTVYYGVLGVNVLNNSNPSYNFFHTSWSGQLAPGGMLNIFGGGCYGPNGYPCAGSAATGEQRDKVIVSQPGFYTMSLYICQSPFTACTTAGSGANWTGPLSSVTFVAINWTPGPPLDEQKPMPDEPCKLILDAPGGTYLDCEE